MYGDIASLLFFRFWRNRWSDLFIETPEGPQSWDCIDGDSGALFLSSISLLAASIIALACNMWINLLIAYNQATASMIGLLSISSPVEVVNVKLKLIGYGHDSLNFPMQCSTLFGCWVTTLEENKPFQPISQKPPRKWPMTVSTFQALPGEEGEGGGEGKERPRNSHSYPKLCNIRNANPSVVEDGKLLPLLLLLGASSSSSYSGNWRSVSSGGKQWKFQIHGLVTLHLDWFLKGRGEVVWLS